MLLTEAEEADRESRAADQATPHHPPAAPQGSCVPVGGSSQRLFTAAGGASWGDALATRARSRLRALLDRLELSPRPSPRCRRDIAENAALRRPSPRRRAVLGPGCEEALFTP